MTTKRQKREEGERREEARLAEREAVIARLEQRRRAKQALKDQAQRRVATARAAASIHRATVEHTAGATPSDASASPGASPTADPSGPIPGEPRPGSADD